MPTSDTARRRAVRALALGAARHPVRGRRRGAPGTAHSPERRRRRSAAARGAAPARPIPRIVIVDVDERSLAALGQWPWRRDRLGALIERLRELGRASRRARSRVQRARSRRPGGPTSMRRSPTRCAAGACVLGYALTFGAPAGSDDRCALHPLPVTVVEPPGSTAAGRCSRPPAPSAACPRWRPRPAPRGSSTRRPTADGILRRVPIVIEMHGGCIRRSAWRRRWRCSTPAAARAARRQRQHGVARRSAIARCRSTAAPICCCASAAAGGRSRSCRRPT